MSVIAKQPETFNRIRSSLRIYRNFTRRDYLNYSEILEREHWLKMDKSIDAEGYQEREIDYFIQRLHIANQIAYLYNYGEKMEFEPLKVNGAMPYGSQKEFLEELQSLRYNLFTNNGRIFLGHKDEQKLDQIIEQLKDIIVEIHEQTMERLCQKTND